jgi:hypothetical protein
LGSRSSTTGEKPDAVEFPVTFGDNASVGIVSSTTCDSCCGVRGLSSAIRGESGFELGLLFLVAENGRVVVQVCSPDVGEDCSAAC